MPIIAVCNQKGGTGKTCTAVHLAHWLKTRKRKQVILIDADPQQSAYVWLQGIEKSPVRAIGDVNELLEQVPELAKSTEFVVIDSPPQLAETARAILFCCDLAVIPMQPTGLDLHSTNDAFRLVRQAKTLRNGNPIAAVFLSRAIKGTRLKNESMSILSQIPDISLLKTVVHQKQAIADAFGQRATIWEMKDGESSAKEYQSLFKEVLELAK
jgi:chromosome partitioning protein